MKRTVLLMMVLAAVYFGCTKMAPEKADDPAQTGCVPQFPDKNVTYNNYVKKIIEQHCTISCHRGGNSLGIGNFTTYAGLAAHTGDVFYFRVIQDNADMPQNGPILPKSTRDSLNFWIRNCSPEN